MHSHNAKKVWKVLFYSLLAIDLGLLAEVCWMNVPAAEAQTTSPWPEMDKNGKAITPDSVLALLPVAAALTTPPRAEPARVGDPVTTPTQAEPARVGDPVTAPEAEPGS